MALSSIKRVVLDPAVGATHNLFIAGLLQLLGQLGIRQQRETKGATLPLFAAHPQAAAVGCDNRLAEVKAKAGAADLGSVMVVAIELGEQFGHDAAIDAQAKIPDSGFD